MVTKDYLKVRAQSDPDNIAILCEGGRVTYRQLDLLATKLANGLRRKGISKGDRIGLLLPNSIEFILCYFALAKFGGIVVPLNTRLKRPEVEFILDHSEMKGLILDAEFVELTQGLKANLRNRIDFVVSGGAAPEGMENLEYIINQGQESDQIVELDEADEAIYFYTSGTTGDPKCVMLTYGNCVSIANIWEEVFELSSEDRIYIVLPLFHSGGLHILMLPGIFAGSMLIVEEGFDSGRALRTMQDNRATVFFGVPTMQALILNHPDLGKYDLSSLRLNIMGAAPVPFNHIKRWKELYPKIKICPGYGQTENSPGATLLKDEFLFLKVGSVGRPIPGVEVKIVDDDGMELPPGQVGEIITKGPNVMKSYYKNPEMTAHTIRDGWLYSGDLGYLDGDGFLYVVDRKKDLIIRGGQNVYPTEVEQILYSCPSVMEAAVVGFPDEILGETGHAFVVTKPGFEPSADELLKRCRANLADYKVPKEIHFVPFLPKNASGKILKRVIRDNYLYKEKMGNNV